MAHFYRFLRHPTLLFALMLLQCESPSADAYLVPDASVDPPSDVVPAPTLSPSDGCATPQCTPDGHGIVDCSGRVEMCPGLEGCDPATVRCANGCGLAAARKESVGCEYFPTLMEVTDSSFWVGNQICYAVVVANTWHAPARVAVELDGKPIAIDSFAYTPQGSGPTLTLTPAPVSSGLAPGGVAILFLSGAQGTGKAHCPVPSAMTAGPMIQGTGKGKAFHVTTDVPVVLYQLAPYGGGNAAITGASLLIPTSAWDTNYIAAQAYKKSGTDPSSFDVVAAEDGTDVTLLPVAAVKGGGGLPASAANVPLTFRLNRGQVAQFSQDPELTGSVLSSSKPIGLLAGHSQLNVPAQVPFADHAEQMIPPIRAMGNEYVGVMHRPRKGEPAMWRLVGAVDDTQLTWTGYAGAASLSRGSIVEFQAADPFVVKSQDERHPFLLFQLMVGSTFTPELRGYGDPDFVLTVPAAQYLQRYVFFADPTYPETNLVIVRRKVNNMFADVSLDCAGSLSGWRPIGEFEWTRVDLSTGDFLPAQGCNTGRHEISSTAPFGVTVWGWGTPLTKSFTENVSYGYPAGMNIRPINPVTIAPVPR